MVPRGEGRGRKISNNKEKADILLNMFECIGNTLVFHSMISWYRRISDRHKKSKANIKTR